MSIQTNPKTEERPIIFQRDVRGGFPILKSAPPVNFGEEGQIVLRDDGASGYTLYAKINGVWRSATLT